MAGNMQGADIAALRELAATMSAASESVTNLSSRLSGQIESATQWVGTDAQKFRANWTSEHRPAMVKVSQMLMDSSQKASQNADQQQEASSVDGGSAGSGLGGGGAAAIGAIAGGGVGGGIAVSGLIGMLGVGDSNARHPGSLIKDLVDGNLQWSDERRASHDFFDSQGEGQFGDLRGQYHANVGAEAYAEAEAGIVLDKDGLNANFHAKAGAEISANIDGSVDLGMLHADANASARAVAAVEANATAGIGPDGASLHVGLDAMAALEAEVNASANLGGVKVEAGASAMAGVGARFNVDGNIGWDEISGSIDVGATLGVGIGGKLDFSFSPQEVADNIGSFVGGIGDVVNDARGDFLDLLGW